MSSGLSTAASAGADNSGCLLGNILVAASKRKSKYVHRRVPCVLESRGLYIYIYTDRAHAIYLSTNQNKSFCFNFSQEALCFHMVVYSHMHTHTLILVNPMVK